MWIARDKNKELYLYKNKPIKSIENWIPNSSDFDSICKLDYIISKALPEVKWEDNEPTEIILRK